MSSTDAAANSLSQGASAPAGKTLFGHPRGLAFLAATEFWDRVSFHGLQALLVLYMVEQLLLPGHVENIGGFTTFRAVVESVTGPLSVQALASQIFGLYTGLTYLTPFIGGLIGDRLLGRRNAVALGALLMTAGHASMAMDQTFLLALLLLILGAGLLRGNLAAQVGDLYPAGDRRRAVAFQIYYALLNTGAFLAPLAIGSLKEGWGWHFGFGFAGFGMFAGLVVYLAGARHVPAAKPRRKAEGSGARLTPDERKVVASIVALLPVSMLFWINQAQIWNTYNIWARDQLQRDVGGFTIPVPWLQSFDSLCVLIQLPILLGFWRRQASEGREPDELVKMGFGCITFGLATACLAFAGFANGPDGRAPLAFAVMFHVIAGVGYLYFAPTAVALVSRTAPQAVNAMMIGVYLLSIFAGSTISGRLGGLYETLPAMGFWLLHGGCGVAAGALFLALRPWFNRTLGPRVLNPGF